MFEHSQQTTGQRGMNTGVHSTTKQGRCRDIAASIVRVLDTARPRIERAAQLAQRYPTRRKLLKRILIEDGVTYQTLFETLDVSERRVRGLVADLRREGVVRTPGNPASIVFASDKIRLALQEVLAFLDSDWVEQVTNSTDDAATALRSLSSNENEENQTLERYLKLMGKLLRGRGWSP
jgi:hypothetical protein